MRVFEKLKRILENSREKTDNERIADLRQKQFDIEAEIAAIQAGKSQYRPFDNTRLREVLGWEPSTSLDAGLRPTYEWIEEQVCSPAAAFSASA